MLFFVCLFWIWVVFNGKLTLEIALFGLVIAGALSLFIWKVMGYHPRKDLKILRNFGRLLHYALVVLWEIVKANYSVIKIVLNPKSKIEPELVYFRTKLKGEAAKTILANSITITPGTITVSVDDDILCVHALDKSMTDGIEDSCFVQRLEKIEKAASGNKEGEK